METKNIYQALAAAQGELKNAAFDKENKFQNYKYASLSSVLDTVRQVLSKNGLALTQVIETIEGQTYLITYLFYGEQQIKSSFPLFFDRSSTSKNPWHDRGSAITYARRYSICALLGIAADEDTDAHGIEESSPLISKKQVDILVELLLQLEPDDRDAFFRWANIERIEELELERFVVCKSMIQKKIKQNGGSDEAKI